MYKQREGATYRTVQSSLTIILRFIMQLSDQHRLDCFKYSIGKDPDAGMDWGQEKGTTEDEMVGWHHRLDGHGFELNSGSWWWTGRPGMLRFMGSQRVGHNWVTELNWLNLQLDRKESWAPNNWCFWTAVLEKTLENLLDCKEIKSVNPKGN